MTKNNNIAVDLNHHLKCHSFEVEIDTASFACHPQTYNLKLFNVDTHFCKKMLLYTTNKLIVNCELRYLVRHKSISTSINCRGNAYSHLVIPGCHSKTLILIIILRAFLFVWQQCSMSFRRKFWPLGGNKPNPKISTISRLAKLLMKKMTEALRSYMLAAKQTWFPLRMELFWQFKNLVYGVWGRKQRKSMDMIKTHCYLTSYLLKNCKKLYRRGLREDLQELYQKCERIHQERKKSLSLFLCDKKVVGSWLKLATAIPWFMKGSVSGKIFVRHWK